MKTKDYNEILLDAIPNLKNCKRACGVEGVAYFYSDEYVVKQYKNISKWQIFGSVFDEFCREMQEFSYITNYPKIYAWTTVPNINFYLGKENNKCDYFILEERIKGRDLYYGFLHDSYNLMKSVCGKKDFYQAIYCPEDCFSLFKKIIETYIEDYISVNEFLESMNEGDIEKFLQDLLLLDTDTKFLNSDIHPTNIILGNNQLRPIDPMVNYLGKGEESSFDIKDFFVCKLVNMFWANEMCQNNSITKYFKYDDSMVGSNFEELQNKNMKICKAAMMKFLKIMNKTLDNPLVFEPSHIKQIRDVLDDLFLDDNKTKTEIISQLNLYERG